MDVCFIVVSSPGESVTVVCCLMLRRKTCPSVWHRPIEIRAVSGNTIDLFDCWPLWPCFRVSAIVFIIYFHLWNVLLCPAATGYNSTCSADTSGDLGSWCRSRLAVCSPNVSFSFAMLGEWYFTESLCLSMIPRPWLFRDHLWGTKEPYGTSNWLSEICPRVYSSALVLKKNTKKPQPIHAFLFILISFIWSVTYLLLTSYDFVHVRRSGTGLIRIHR